MENGTIQLYHYLLASYINQYYEKRKFIWKTIKACQIFTRLDWSLSLTFK